MAATVKVIPIQPPAQAPALPQRSTHAELVQLIADRNRLRKGGGK